MKDNVNNCKFQNRNHFLCARAYRPNEGIYQKISGAIKIRKKKWCFEIAIVFWNPISSKKLMGKNKNVRKPRVKKTHARKPVARQRKKLQNRKLI